MEQKQQSPGLFMKASNILLALSCYTPIFWLVAFYSYVWRVTIHLGHIPRYSGAGTDDITLSQAHEDIIGIAFTLALFSPIFVLLFALITHKSGNKRFKTINAIIYGATLILSFLLLQMDGFFEWYVD